MTKKNSNKVKSSMNEVVKVLLKGLKRLAETQNEAALSELGNAIQKYTGLPGVIYFCTKDEIENPQAHTLGRIKWVHAGKEAYVSIKPNKDGKRKLGGDPRMIHDLERFVIKNEDLLWAYWNTPMDQADSAETMRRFQKVLAGST